MLDLVSHIYKPFQAFTIYNLFYWFCLRYQWLKLWLLPAVTLINGTVWKHENPKFFSSRTLISLSFNSNFLILWKNVGIHITWTFLMFLFWLSIVFTSEFWQNKPRKLANTSVLMEVAMVHLEQLWPKKCMWMSHESVSSLNSFQPVLKMQESLLKAFIDHSIHFQVFRSEQLHKVWLKLCFSPVDITEHQGNRH